MVEHYYFLLKILISKFSLVFEILHLQKCKRNVLGPAVLEMCLSKFCKCVLLNFVHRTKIIWKTS